MASVAAYPDTLRTHLPLEPTDVVLFGLALGHGDSDAPANRTRTTREPVDAVISFLPS
jgi:ectoine hydroxylase-related dioxygenase (phytanoyl-CoA dioxygenase family)